MFLNRDRHEASASTAPRSALLLAIFVALPLLEACSDGLGPELCAGEASASVGLGSCVAFEDDGLLGTNRGVVEDVVGQTLVSVNQVMPVTGIRVRVIADATQVIPEVGLGGFASDGQEILIYFDPDLPDLTGVFSHELFPLLAHEIHHVKRIRTVGYGSWLLAAAVSEGLADHFSVEVAGVEPPPWSVALAGSELADWIAQATAVGTGTYDHSRWFFGTDPEVPRWAGYAIGYELVRAFLAVNPERRASGLFDEPTTSFLPE